MTGRAWRRGWAAVAAVAVAGAAAPAKQLAAQRGGESKDSTRDHTAPSAPQWSVGGWAALGQHQMIKTRLGRKHDRQLYLVGFRAARALKAEGKFALDYTADVVPLMLATANREYERQVVECPVPGHPLCAEYYPQIILIPSRHTAYGFGVTPVGLRARYALAGPVQALMGLSGGVAAFDRRIPDPDERRFNFTAEGSLGLLLRTRAGRASAGIRWHHISNGNTGRVNPALDSRMWFLGFER